MSFSPRIGFKPQLTVRKPINSLILSPTLLQIYCIGPIGLIPQFFWVWATICDPTLSFHLNLRLTFIASQFVFVLVAQRKTFSVYFLFSAKVMNESQKNFILPGPLISSIYLVFNFFFPFNLQTEQFLLVILLFFSMVFRTGPDWEVKL